MSEPGWYDTEDGRRRWWDGQAWGNYSVPDLSPPALPAGTFVDIDTLGHTALATVLNAVAVLVLAAGVLAAVSLLDGGSDDQTTAAISALASGVIGGLLLFAVAQIMTSVRATALLAAREAEGS